MNSPQRIVLIIFILIIASYVFIITSQKNASKENLTESSLTKTELKLTPSSVSPDGNNTVTLQVVGTAAGTSIDDVHFDLFYDPKSLQLLSITPLQNGKETQKEIDSTGGKCCINTGKIVYGAIYTATQKNTKNIPLVQMVFKAKKTSGVTEVRFIKASLNGNSVEDAVIKPAYAAQINLKKK